MKEQEILQLKEEFQKSDLTRKGQILEYVAQDNDFFKMNEPWEQIEKNINFPRLQPSKYIEEVLVPEFGNIKQEKEKLQEFLSVLEPEGIDVATQDTSLEATLEKQKAFVKNNLLGIDEKNDSLVEAIERLSHIKDFELSPLVIDDSLMKYAKFRTIETYMLGSMGYHSGYLDSRDYGVDKTIAKHKLPAVGELMTGLQNLSSDAVKMWIIDSGQRKDSNGNRTAGHREALVNGRYKYIGYWTQKFTVLGIGLDSYIPRQIPFYINIGTSAKPYEAVKESPLKKEEPIATKKVEPEELKPTPKTVSEIKETKTEEPIATKKTEPTTQSTNPEAYALNYLEGNFELALEKKYGRDLSADDVHNFFTDSSFLNMQNIFDNMGFFYDTDLTMFVKESDINIGLLQALSFIDVTLPPKEVEQNIQRLSALSGKIDIARLTKYLEDNKSIIQSYPAYNKSNKTPLDITKYEAAVKELNDLKLEDPKYTVIKPYNVKEYLGDVLSSINDNGQKKLELIASTNNNDNLGNSRNNLLGQEEPSISLQQSNTNKSVGAIQNFGESLGLSSSLDMILGNVKPSSTKETILGQSNKVGSSESVVEGTNNNGMESLVSSGINKGLNIGQVKSTLGNIDVVKNDSESIFKSLKEGGLNPVEKILNKNISNDISNVLSGIDKAKNIVDTDVTIEGSDTKKLIAELGKGTGVDSLLEKSDIMKSQAMLINTLSEKVDIVNDSIKKEVGMIKNRLETLDPTNNKSIKTELVSGDTNTLDEKGLSSETKFPKATEINDGKSTLIPDDVEDVAMNTVGLVNLPTFDLIGVR